MRVHIHVNGFYEWEPAPADVVVTKQDVAAGKVRPAFNAPPGTDPNAPMAYLMKVPKIAETHVEVIIAENQIIGEILFFYCDKNKQGVILTRAEAVKEIIASRVVPLKTHRKWMKHIEVHDDGPSEELYRAMLAPHLAADHARAPGKNIDAEDVDELVAAYLAPMTADGHRDHLHAHFKLAPAAVKGSV